MTADTPTARDLMERIYSEMYAETDETGVVLNIWDTPSGAALIARADAADAAQTVVARLRGALTVIRDNFRDWEHGEECESWGALDAGADEPDESSCDCGLAVLLDTANAALAHSGPSPEPVAEAVESASPTHPWPCDDPDHSHEAPRAAPAWRSGPLRCAFFMEDMGFCGWYDIWSGHQPPFGDPDYSHHPFTPEATS